MGDMIKCVKCGTFHWRNDGCVGDCVSSYSGDILGQIKKRLSATVGLLATHDRWLLREAVKEIEELRKAVGRANKLVNESQTLCDKAVAERDDYQRALEQYALHRNWSCCDLDENHVHGVNCCRDWWQGADDEDLDSGYVLAEEVLKRHAAKAAGGNDDDV